MVSIYKSKAKAITSPQHPELDIERWDQEAQSIAYHQGKICFVEGALPGERVKVRVTEQKAHYLKAQVTKILQSSPLRIAPQCRYFGTCGGCQLHYISAENSRILKQQALDQQLQHQLKLENLPWQPVLAGPDAGYRRKARIGVWFEKKTNSFTVGFRKAGGKEITEVTDCMVLSPVIAPVFAVLQQTLPTLKQGSAVTHVEVLDADGQAFVVVRHIRPLPEADQQKLQQAWPEACWIGEAEPDQFSDWSELVTTASAKAPPRTPTYQLANGQKLSFAPTDFIQVNAVVNKAMVEQAIAWLAPAKTDQILDLYCGIGNFSLALAKQAGMVVGLEGVAAMVTTASQNASVNGLDNTSFAQVDLHLPWPKADWNQPKYQKVLLDPARAGALGAIDEVARLKPAQVLYVSCNPTTFARDAKVLLAKGYRLDKIGMMDMFPYTSHLELMALFSHTRQ
ncbi:23S rRNA (uracil(1939)-C(5))-methyltransferase [Rheinheimera sp. SA_1]|uniref:23S rRNA (uracil(1939)-C(5))-methyltransferase RlmD n=1 Tax=Rheinheimera sp. SA_1 TaxID=1827365 RepID=UPI0007FD4CE3|nr:23S rRNA (uracil(1939)-C(5))-methyltransferase RlmD [Rheinheimera sp. SA_1]OBP13882.1 23S rRNA (uracil(1939)-C(5))-methyltransferase [Rheinheimera sp. SA_1]